MRWRFLFKKFEREVNFTPAFDKRNKNPKKDYGIGSAQIRFLLHGRKGTVQLLLGTDWYLSEEARKKMAEIDERFKGIHKKSKYAYLKGWDLGYHSFKPHYEGHTIMEECTALDGKKCYYDGSTLNAETYPDILIEKGSDEIWKELEEYYRAVFNEKKHFELGAMINVLCGKKLYGGKNANKNNNRKSGKIENNSRDEETIKKK